MSLPKKEVAVWLPAETHAKLKALADAKSMSMGQWAAYFLEAAVDRKFMEAVSIYRSVVSSGLYTEGQEPTRQQSEFPDSAMDPRSL
jgi:hypothetical protein